MGHRATVGIAQVGGIQPDEQRASVVRRLIALLDDAASSGCRLVVFPELTLTTFFPRYWRENPHDMDQFFEREMPNLDVQPLFDRARELSIAFVLGFAELTPDGRRYNAACAVDDTGAIVGHYRKIHLPGHDDDRGLAHQHLEKRYFDIGDVGFPVVRLAGVNVGLAICNDRRWAETYRVLALQGADLIAIGYNTPASSVPGTDPEPHRAMEEHLLSVRAGAYQNAVWVLAAGKSGTEDGQHLIGGSCAVAPSGDVVARALHDGDELIVTTFDADAAAPYRREMFDFDRHRRPDQYQLIVERVGRGGPVASPSDGAVR